MANWKSNTYGRTYVTMFNRADSFNIDLSIWIVSSVTNMAYMFSMNTAFTQKLCGITWIESTADKNRMFFKGDNVSPFNEIGTEICSCSPGKFFTVSSKSCTECESGRFQAQPGAATSCESWTTTSCSFGMESAALARLTKASLEDRALFKMARNVIIH